MESSFDSIDKKSGTPRLTAGCPFLGLIEDAETHFSTPSQGNYCHKVDPSESINFEHQESFCLSNQFNTCLIFLNDWEGDLPETIRGDGKPGQLHPVPLAKVKQNEAGKDAGSNAKEIVSETRSPSKGMESTGKSGKRTETPDSLPWTRLHEEARSRYLDSKPRNKDRYIWAGLIVVASIIFLASLWGLYNRFGELQTQAELSMLSARTLAAVTADFQLTKEMNATATARALFFLTEDTPTPTLTPEDSGESDPASLTETAQALAALENTVNCSDIGSYSYELVSGPELSPRPGYVHLSSAPEPTIQAAWVIKNDGDCDWEQVVLKNSVTNESVVPILQREDIEVDLTDLQQVIKSGEEIEVIVRFKLNDAATVNRDWLLMVNGFSLFEHSHVVLKVDNWIFVQTITATPTTPPKKPPEKATPTPKPRSTPTPGKATEPPPTREPESSFIG